MLVFKSAMVIFVMKNQMTKSLQISKLEVRDLNISLLLTNLYIITY